VDGLPERVHNLECRRAVKPSGDFIHKKRPSWSNQHLTYQQHEYDDIVQRLTYIHRENTVELEMHGYKKAVVTCCNTLSLSTGYASDHLIPYHCVCTYIKS
jgi:hypothetical protein